MEKNSIYIILMREATGETKAKDLQLAGRDFLSVGEILKHFDIHRLFPSETIWIKRSGADNFRYTPYGCGSQLAWEQFNKCVIFLGRQCPQELPAPQIMSRREIDLRQQLEIWREKEEKRSKKAGLVPIAVKKREQAIRAIKKKKILKRLAQECEGEKPLS